MSKLGQSFILKMLAFNPSERMSAAEALRDPWILTNSE
jgi:serine/threonine protein kinase